MANYRINEDAKADMQRINRRGVLEFGEAQADRYFNAFFERFEDLAEQPYQYQAVDDIRMGY
jgi:toxin ParE1/3/4